MIAKQGYTQTTRILRIAQMKILRNLTVQMSSKKNEEIRGT